MAVNTGIEKLVAELRTKLLDLRNSNKLLSFKHTSAKTHVRVVDEDPNFLHHSLTSGRQLSFSSLPEPTNDFPDEKTDEFLMALEAARLLDPDWITLLSEDEDIGSTRAQKLDREIRNRVREQLGMPPAKEIKLISPADWARMHGIRPNFDLPELAETNRSSKHTDTEIQTLLFPDELQGRLARVMDETRTAQQEMGVNVLHFAIGFLEWYETKQSDKAMLAPLLLYPAELDRKPLKEKGQYRYFVRGDQEPTINITLQKRLEKDFNIIVPPLGGEQSPDDYFAEITKSIKDQPRWRVRRFATLGLFSFSRVVMYNDLDPKNWGGSEKLVGAGVIADLFGRREASSSNPEEYELETPEVEDEVPLLIRDADSSQHHAIIDVMRGKNLVIKGPPGTGKSQTIANIIAAAVAKEQSVLFVAEKAAALDVVKKRLDEAGLGVFCLELHSTKAKKVDVLASIKVRMDAKTPRSSHSIKNAVQELRAARQQLARYADLINSRFSRLEFLDTGKWRPATIHDILWAEQRTRSEEPAFPALDRLFVADAAEISRFDLDARCQQLQAIENQAAEFQRDFGGHDQHPWSFVARDDVNVLEHSDILDRTVAAKRSFERLDAIQKEAVAQFSELFSGASPSELESQCALVLGYPEPPQPLHDPLFRELFRGGISPSEVEQFSALVAGVRESEEKLQRSLPQNGSIEQIAELEGLAPIAQKGSLGNVCLAELDGMLLRLNDEVASLGVAVSCGRELFSAFDIPGVALTPENIKRVLRAAELLKSADTRVISYRVAGVMVDTAEIVIQAAKKEARILNEREDRLSNLVTVTVSPPPPELRRNAATLRSTGLLGKLSKDYKEAKRAAAAVIRLGENGKDGVLADLLIELAEFLESHSKLESDIQLKAICGVHYYGRKTNFDALLDANRFASTVREQFGSLSPLDRAIRKVLLESDDDHLRGILALIETQAFAKLSAIVLRSGNEDRDLEAELDEKRGKASAAATILDKMSPCGFGPQVSYDDAAAVPRLADDVSKGRSKIAEHRVSELIGYDIGGDLPDLASLDATRSYACLILNDTNLKEATEAFLSHSPDVAKSSANAKEAAARLREQIDDAFRSVEDLVQAVGKSPSSTNFNQLPIAELVRRLDNAVRHEEALPSFVQFRRALEEARNNGLSALIGAFEDNKRHLNHLAGSYRRIIYRSLARITLTKYPELGRAKPLSLDAIRTRFKNLDAQITELQREALVASLFGRKVPPGIQSPRARDCTEATLLKNEIAKKRKHIPIRDLMERSAGALRALKPCMMLSPSSVSQFLKPGQLFDLVVIDEASQMRPEEAIGSMARARQVVIVGDPQQLPPSNFFARQDDDSAGDPEEEDKIVAESILDIGIVAFQPSRELLWHYRSRIGSLISFSNRHFYDDRLIVFPSPLEGSPEHGVKLVEVAGEYRSSVNVPEAIQVAHAAIEFMKKHPGMSLGIVALNQPQRDLILAEMDRLFVRDTQAEKYRRFWSKTLEPFFVKNLENVQGDERDAIFISTVYGPDKSGNLMQRFGPINGAAGDRRLNVLFSRAKHEVRVFSSMRPDQIRVDATTPRGTRLLKSYLEFAATGRLDEGTQTYRDCESDFELFVKEQLERKGYEVVAQVGVMGFRIDLGVRHPDWPFGFLLGIECDGATYHSSLSARDRDRLRQQVLEGLGWTIYRIWSTDWFSDPRRELAKLVEFIETLLRTKQEEYRSRQQESPAFDDIIDVEEEELGTEITTVGASFDGDNEEFDEGEGSELDDDEDRPTLVAFRTTPAPVSAAMEGEAPETLQLGYAGRPSERGTGDSELFPLDPDELLEELRPKLSPTSFYEPHYGKILAQLSALIIDAQGPITFKHLSERVARAHGFQRTGSEIKQRVWAAVSRLRSYSSAPDGQKTFWPKDMPARGHVNFRGLRFGSVTRGWADVPYEEKVGLALSVLGEGGKERRIEAMAKRIGLERLRAATREELEDLIRAAEQLMRQK